jgi:gamma-glutamyltranspeptidase
VIDFRERAPLASTRDMYLDAAENVRPDASTMSTAASA